MNGVNTATGSPDFGKVTSAYDPRVFQLGAKVMF
jgi:3D (Asp-Asp-Asp) domain-containing protein